MTALVAMRSCGVSVMCRGIVTGWLGTYSMGGRAVLEGRSGH